MSHCIWGVITGGYPSSETEKEIFRNRKLDYVGQMALQKYMMEELLGIKTEFLFLVARKENSGTHKVISWADAFGCLEMSEMPGFAVEMAGNVSFCFYLNNFSLLQ